MDESFYSDVTYDPYDISPTITALSSATKKQDTILWEIQNAREVLDLASLTGNSVASISFDISDIDKKLQFTVNSDPSPKTDLCLKIEFLNANQNDKEKEPGAALSASGPRGRSTFSIVVSTLHASDGFWNCVFKRSFLGDSVWTHLEKLRKVAEYENSEGLFTFRFEVTEYLGHGKELCKTIITTPTTGAKDPPLDILRIRNTINNNNYHLARDNLVRDFASLLGDERTADIKISVKRSLAKDSDEIEEVKVFCGHKAILSARNEVFRKMFENKEMKEGKEGHVEIRDISIKAMEWFLRYLYTGVVVMNESDAEEEQRFLQLLPEIPYIADKYNDEYLKNVGESNLHRCATSENIRDLLNCARLHGLTAAEAELRKIIARDPNKYLDAFLND